MVYGKSHGRAEGQRLSERLQNTPRIQPWEPLSRSGAVQDPAPHLGSMAQEGTGLEFTLKRQE